MRFSSFLVGTLSAAAVVSQTWAFAPIILHRSAVVSRQSSSQLFLADEIKQYRQGLSQIHKNATDDNSSITQKDVVFKFGGSSLADASRIDHVAQLIKDQIDQGYRPRAVVCSAMGKTTNNLLSAGEMALGALLNCCIE